MINMSVELTRREDRYVKTICLVLIGLEMTAFIATLVTAGVALSFVRAAGIATFGLAVVSALVGVMFVAYGLMRGAPVVWKWGALLLLIDVAPLAILMILGNLSSVP